ncbi:MAG: isochorismatase family protein [Actinomycetota bacterium]|nr:isochorismatase family protein [Actinomycetota bacterium]
MGETTFAQGFAGSLTPGKRPALIVIDMMRAYYVEGSAFRLPSTSSVESAGRVLAAARAARIPVVHTRVEFGPNAIDGGVFVRKVPALRALIGQSELGRFMPQVEPAEDELVIVKQYASAFFGTTLQSTLTAMGVDTLFIAGVSTSGCVRATGVDAVQHGFIPFVIRDAVGDRGPEPHEANLYDLQAKYAEVIGEELTLTYFSEVGQGA